jgi:hypothetical protein
LAGAAAVRLAEASGPSAAAAARLRQLMEQARAPTPAMLSSEEQAKRMKQRSALLARGEAGLQSLDVEAALAAFERAAALMHAADSEMGLVRTYMQGGEYRRAMAFVAHTANAHRDNAGGAALYAWLLNLGGHGLNAQRMLAEAQERFAGDALLQTVQRQLQSRVPHATGALLRAPARLAPYAKPVPAGARCRATGLLIDEGRRALVPATASRDAVWLRNGLGQVSRASVETRLSNDLSVVRLAQPLPGKAAMLATSDAFPGSVAFAVEYVTAIDASPSWPVLTGGFLGAAGAGAGVRSLGVELPPGPRGGPVFDASGRLIGLAAATRRGADRVLLVSALRVPLGERLGEPTAANTNKRPVDEIYESALQSVVQVIDAV